MAWCHQAKSHYLSQCWLRSMSPYGVTRSQWVNNIGPQSPYHALPILKMSIAGHHHPILSKYIWVPFNTLRQRKNVRHFADGIFKRIFLDENAWISLNISLKFVPKVRINTIPALVQIMAWRRPGNKPLSEPMMFSLLMHICVTRPQWVKYCQYAGACKHSELLKHVKWS